MKKIVGDLIIEKISRNVHQHLEVLVNHYLLVALALVPNSNYFWNLESEFSFCSKKEQKKKSFPLFFLKKNNLFNN